MLLAFDHGKLSKMDLGALSSNKLRGKLSTRETNNDHRHVLKLL
jgi:hypothetical protein